MKVGTAILVFMVSWFIAESSQSVIVTSDGEYPAIEFSPRIRVEGGYRLDSVIDEAKVVFPVSGWKYIPTTYPGGRYVVDPATGVCFRFNGVSFGHKLRDFLFLKWAWTTSEHQWARQFHETKVSNENQANFLKQWIKRALVARDIEHPDNLSIVYPLLSANKPTARTMPLRLDPVDQPFHIQEVKVGSHSFSNVNLATFFNVDDQKVSLESSVYVAYFRYLPRYEDWRFFVAFSHVPIGLSTERKQQARELFQNTLGRLSVKLTEGNY